MKIINIETERLFIRNLSIKDSNGIFEMDSDPEVQKFLGKKPIQNISEATDYIVNVQKEYKKYGTGRLAVLEKETGYFIGWCGLKFINTEINSKSEYYDIGYRFIKRYWGKGYATESAFACINFGFKELNQEEVYAMAESNHRASRNILRKLGMNEMNEFKYDNTPHTFYKISKQKWINYDN
ncbi:GNAT family N-acetyltransferase [Christiangramia echinicola]|uniref:Ribosomal-protein-alanine N-acetyltransferase n=1 Tax=Christiangramia echinicola TaxID=279359 RepID=A0A1H1KUA8_9FLAO|nr:GNAT family N-acetyltransferase [Christiangramia echinicola]SDR65873.1 ribosomal-protein-alanine N-acetyltransferase [Christiangramia echinicola]